MVHIEEFPALPDSADEIRARQQAAVIRESCARLQAAAAGAEGDTTALVEASVRLQAAVVAAQAELSDTDKLLADRRCELGNALMNQENDLVGGAAEFCQALAANPWHAEALCGLGSVLG